MTLKLRAREIPTVEFRRALPAFLGPEGEECFIEIDARAAGAINPAYMAGMEQGLLQARIMDRKTDRIEDDEEFVKSDRENVRATVKARLRVLYDTCIMGWRSNIIDDGEPITCDREHFLALFEVRGFPEISEALMAFELECLKAGKLIEEDDKATEKN